MSGIAMVFPGQGSQYAGMGQDLYNNFEEARAVFDQANDILGFSVSRLCFDGPKDQLDLTEYAQPAVLTCSLASLAVLESRGVQPQIVAGLSLGEYTALTAAGAVSMDEVLPLVQARARFMQNAVPAGKGAMAAVIGLPGEQVGECCSQAGGQVTVANFNAPGQVVISGEKDAVDSAAAILSQAGARVVPLAVSIPSHSPLMRGAAEALMPHLENISWKEPRIPVIGNASAREHESGSLPDMLARQMYSPVLWEKSVRSMLEKSGRLIEVGPGTTLSSLIKRIDRKAVIGHAEDSKSLDSLMEKI